MPRPSKIEVICGDIIVNGYITTIEELEYMAKHWRCDDIKEEFNISLGLANRLLKKFNIKKTLVKTGGKPWDM